MNPTSTGEKRVLQDRARAAKRLAALANSGPNANRAAAKKYSATADQLVRRLIDLR